MLKLRTVKACRGLRRMGRSWGTEGVSEAERGEGWWKELMRLRMIEGSEGQGGWRC
jgi:hypothetical protein